MKQPQFGALPTGKRLELIKKSPNYKDGKFRNLIEKPTISDGYSMLEEIWNTMFKNIPMKEPVGIIPSIKTDLKTLHPKENVMIWFGHSSFFCKLMVSKFL
ncbi:hypothetical protein [Soonwooa buanensis]|nr:hypothetical protein [Soonwooa buanensis]